MIYISYISALFFIVGLFIIVIHSNWWVAIGVLCMIFSFDIHNKFSELQKRKFNDN